MVVANIEPQEMDGILPGGLTWHWTQGEGLEVYRGDCHILSVVWNKGRIRMEHYDYDWDCDWDCGAITMEQKFMLGRVATQIMDMEQPVVKEMWRIAAPYARMTLADTARKTTQAEFDDFFYDGNPVYYKTLTDCINLVRTQMGMQGEGWDEAFSLYSNVYTYADEVEQCIIETLRPYFAFEFVVKEPDEDD